MKRNKYIAQLSLISIVLIGLYSFLEYGHQYFLKNFFESDTFQSDYDDFTHQLGSLVLNPADGDEAKKKIKVSSSEIEDYRNYYGSLGEQIANIKDQYRDRIQEAKDAKATTVEEALIKEREKKIKDITKNFEDDQYVRDKIIKIKEKDIDQYISDRENNKEYFFKYFSYYSYNLTDLETGQSFVKGNVKGDTAYTKQYNRTDDTLDLSLSSDDIVYEGSDGISYDVSNLLEQKTHRYTGSISISEKLFTQSSYYEEYKNFQFHKRLLYFIWLVSIFSIIALFLLRPFQLEIQKGRAFYQWIRKWPIDIRGIFIALNLFATLFAVILLSEHLVFTRIYGTFFNKAMFVFTFIFEFALLFVLVHFIIRQSMMLMKDLDTGEKRAKAIKESILLHVIKDIQHLFLSRSIGLQSIALLITVFLAGVGIVIVSDGSGGAFLLYMFLFMFVATPAALVFLRRMGYLNRMMKQTEDMAKGRLSGDIPVRGKSPFAQHAANLNALREGVRSSITEQAKSERLKTELITNVSHDLRTPLTSIITYTDLLKNPALTEDERNSYIAILDKKSQRLKTLIEDLFEVSKMATGNIELHKQRVDLNQLVKQAVGEHEEEIEKANMSFRVQLSEEPLFAYVDGQKWWRVLDNLLINALKYTMEGTRVYITLEKVNDKAQFVIKNITKYEFGDQNVEELYERFKRADTARHTEGSGLGLAIAQSIVDLHQGSMEITIDGDLFKVVVSVPLERLY